MLTSVTRVHKTVLALAGIAVLVSNLVGCGQEQDGHVYLTPEDAVRERAQARWNALIEGDLKEAYTFTSPAFRTRVPFERYRSRFGGSVQWIDAEVTAVECAEDLCKATVMLTYQIQRPRAENSRPIEESWIEREGEWWIYIR